MPPRKFLHHFLLPSAFSWVSTLLPKHTFPSQTIPEPPADYWSPREPVGCWGKPGGGLSLSWQGEGPRGCHDSPGPGPAWAAPSLFSLCCLSASLSLCRPSPTCRSEVSRAGPCGQGVGLPPPPLCGPLLWRGAEDQGKGVRGAFIMHRRAFSQNPASQGIPGGACSCSCPALPCAPLPNPAPHPTAELGEGLNLCPARRSLSKLCPSRCFYVFLFFCFLTACHYRGQKHQSRGKSQGHETSQKPHNTSYTNTGSPGCKWSPAGSRLAACLPDTVLFSA